MLSCLDRFFLNDLALLSPIMTGDVVQVSQQEDTSPEEPVDAECPVCYQEYNRYNKCPRMLRCHHVFCIECLQRIQLSPSDPTLPHSPPAIPCPLCRCLTPLEDGDDAFAFPCNSHILARLPHVAFSLPGSVATVTQRVVLSLEADIRDAHFIILPTVSLRVQHPGPGGVQGLVGEDEDEDEVRQQSRRKVLYVQLLAVTFWVLFVITCVVGVVFGPHFFKNKF